MNSKRYKDELNRAFYHIWDRIAGRQFLFTDDLKRKLREFLYKVAFFSGVDVLSYAFMTDHIHLLVAVPPKNSLVTEEEIIKRVSVLYGMEKGERLKNKLAFLREQGKLPEAEKLLDSYRCRMNDVSEFMKSLKSRITIYYNNNCERDGTLWERRFNSVILEEIPNLGLLRAVAAYIDLNPVRAKMVSTPQRYGWNGCHDPLFEKNLSFLFPAAPPEKRRELYDKYLLSRMQKKGYVWKDSLGMPSLFETRIRNLLFTRCRAIGGRAFISRVAGDHPPGGVTSFACGEGDQLMTVGRLTRCKKHLKEG